MEKKIGINIKRLPSLCGCYLIKDGNGKILYVGKAVNLKSRVGSYFRKSARHSPRIERLILLAEKVDFIVTRSELEALILENNLIKKEKPRFNVMMRDDKTYPYLKITTGEKFPRLQIVRKILKDGALYFGPYVSAKSVRTAKQLIHRIFPIRSSKDKLDNAKPRRPCLNYQMKRCLAPCSGKVSRDEYGKMVERAKRFLNGRDSEVIKELEQCMRQAADKQEFERAAILRDQIRAIRSINEKQKVEAASGHSGSEDYIAAVCEGGAGIVRIMMARSGKLTADRNFTFPKADDTAELMGAFIQQFYNSAFAVASDIFVNVMPADVEVITGWLCELRGAKVVISKPKRGRKKQLLEMAVENAGFNLLNFTAGESARKEALGEIKELCRMENWPAVMEAIDVSNISGSSAVGSLVQFFNGEARKSEYKRYKISVAGPDDFAMISEVARRRFRRLESEGGKFPDVLLIDGGASHASAVANAIAEYAPEQVIVGIAKGRERDNSATDRFFLYGHGELPFPEAGAGRFMLQRLRDEAHRFAIRYHRNLRGKTAYADNLEAIPGFGPKRKMALIKEFGSLKAVKNAGVEDIRRLLSVSEKLAEKILKSISP